MKILLKILLCCVFLFFFCFDNKIAYACDNNINQTIFVGIKKYTVNNKQENYICLTNKQFLDFNNVSKKIKYIKKLKSMGFKDEIILKYLFPYLYDKIINVIKNEEIQPINAEIKKVENFAKIKTKKHKNGCKIDKNKLFNNIINNLTNNKSVLYLEKLEVFPDILYNDILKYSVLRSEFVTNFKNSSLERKNNIKIALKSLDGIILKPNEVFSFNNIVGVRTEENGYKNAKIISKGKFIDSVGGGVCQVSTTLYNCALLSGLEIIEVNSHSLKVSYIEPGFDSMVNMGCSDLKFKNNTDYPIIITTSSVDDLCKVVIYGIKNNCKYERISEYIENEKLDNNIIQPSSVAQAKIVIYKEEGEIEEKFLREVKYGELRKN